MKTLPHSLSTQRLTHFLVITILLIGAFLRLWNFIPSLMFQGDQGRDAIIAHNILKEHDLVLIGPVTSTGNMYLGPLYYYLMVPFLAATYPSPTGPAYMIASLSIITILLIYHLGKELVGVRAAIIAAALFSFSSVAVTYARFSWNPNPAPLVSIILVWAVFRAMSRRHSYWILAALCIAVLSQLHYVTLLTIPATGMLWLIALWRVLKTQTVMSSNQSTTQTTPSRLSHFAFASVIGLLVFVISFAPLVAFDLRHQNLNSKAFQSFLSQDQGTLNARGIEQFTRAVKETHGRSLQVFGEQFFGKKRTLNTLIVLAVTLSLCYFGQKQKEKIWNSPELVLGSFLGWAAVGLAFYQSSVFDHYILYLLPITFLTCGLLLGKIYNYNWGKLIIILFMTSFIGYNTTRLPLSSAGWQLHNMKDTAQSILNRVKKDQKYNIVLLSGSGDIDGQNYRYFLETSEKPPVSTSQRGEVETLFIINEDRKSKKVTDSPIYEIVVFPNKEPLDVYTIPGGPEITVLQKKP